MGDVLISRRGGVGGGTGQCTVSFLSVCPDGNETITYTGAESGTVNIVLGSASILLPVGTYIFTSSNTSWTSGSIAITGDTTINCYSGTPLYWYGNFISPLTNSWTDSTSSHTVGTNQISVTGGGTSTNMRYSALNARLDLSGYSTLGTIARGSSPTSSYHYVGITSSNASPKPNIQASVAVGGTTYSAHTLDISSLSSGYIAIGAADNRTTYVKALWLE